MEEATVSAMLLYASRTRTCIVSVLEVSVHGQEIELKLLIVIPEPKADGELTSPPAVKVPVLLAPYQIVGVIVGLVLLPNWIYKVSLESPVMFCKVRVA